jgi:hypothetical protein
MATASSGSPISDSNSPASSSGAPAYRRQLIEVFLYLQILDILTTLIGFRLGSGEASPFVRLLVQFGPTEGLLLSKIVAVGIAATCLLLRKRKLIMWINYWYAALVVWNLYTILRVLHA